MRKLYIALAVPLMMAVTACGLTTTGSSPGVSPNTDPSTGITAGTLVDEKALYAAEAAYNVAAQAYVAADSNGQLSPSMKANVKPVMTKAYEALLLARAAYNAGDAGGFAEQVEAVKTLAGQARSILPTVFNEPQAPPGGSIP